MTREQADKLYIEKCVGKNLLFSSYYKYSFSYRYETDDTKLFVQWGGNSDDIYRSEFNDTEKLPDTLQELLDDDATYIILEDKKSGDKFEWSDF